MTDITSPVPISDPTSARPTGTGPTTPVPAPSGQAGAVHAVLVPGWWLGGWAWADVEPQLQAAGIATHSVTLPGLDGADAGGLTLDDQVEFVTTLVDGLEGDVVLVGHSGGGAVVQGVADRRPERIRRIVYVDTGPLVDGLILQPDTVADLPLPSWDELTESELSVDGMDEATLARFRERSVAQPAAVASSPIRVSDDARLDVPTTVVCTSIPSRVLRRLIAEGQMPSELPTMSDVRYVDLPTGHWPMFSRPTDLAMMLRHEIHHV